MTFKPHDYQKEALAHLYKERRAALWMPMGGGVLDMSWPHK